MVEEKSLLKDMDEYLKLKLVDFWFDANSLITNGDFKRGFRAYKMMFKMVEPYNFADKVILQELTVLLQNYMDSIGNHPVNSSELLLFNKSKIEFRALLDKYTSLLPKAFVDLNLWFKSVSSGDDFDLRLSEENFNSDLSFVNKKRSALEKLSVKQLLDLLSLNAINEAHARGVNYNVL